MGDAGSGVYNEVGLRRAIERLVADHDPTGTPDSEFWGAQYDLGLAWVDFPVGFGGQGLPVELQRVVDRELAAVNAPVNRFRNFVGVGMAAPTLNGFAGEATRARLLRPLYTCDEIWCQLFSEPGAGSDLAALATRAVRDGDEWIVTGQKVWTTLAHVARWGLLLARTNTEQPKHQGLTYFYIDMHSAGVDVRPLRQLTGAADFNEVYLEEVRVPDTHRLGPVGAGWRVAMTTLSNERAAVGGLGNGAQGNGAMHRAFELVRRSAATDPILRDRLCRLWAESEIIRVTALRAEAGHERGRSGPETSVMKLLTSTFQQRLHEFCVDALGPGGTLISEYEMVQPTTILDTTVGDGDVDPVKAYLRTRGLTIGGGTSEIARNVVGEQVLGLPPEPRVDKSVSWSALPRSS